MRNLRLRFSLRTLMIAIAVIAFLIAGYQVSTTCYRRWAYASNRSRYHEMMAKPFASNALAMRPGMESCEKLAVAFPHEADRYLQDLRTMKWAIEFSETRAAYHRSLQEKYRQAASKPWIPIDYSEPPAPNPPAPR